MIGIGDIHGAGRTQRWFPAIAGLDPADLMRVWELRRETIARTATHPQAHIALAKALGIAPGPENPANVAKAAGLLLVVADDYWRDLWCDLTDRGCKAIAPPDQHTRDRFPDLSPAEVLEFTFQAAAWSLLGIKPDRSTAKPNGVVINAPRGRRAGGA